MEDVEENHHHHYNQQQQLQFCSECLRRRVKSDFSDQLIFSYGISISPLPFSSSAVVQVSFFLSVYELNFDLFIPFCSFDGCSVISADEQF